ncbi:hypothetical protein Srufu_054090 [Streptomyces libani subsp. rufus]|nr:hypothetical protein Srufu_054090 [Streptomyces libani subsp. rufus]
METSRQGSRSTARAVHSRRPAGGGAGCDGGGDVYEVNDMGDTVSSAGLRRKHQARQGNWRCITLVHWASAMP